MTRYNCKTAKELPIIDYLELCGIQPQRIKGHNYWYLSPLREEKTASFKVNTKLNAWMDFGEGIGGNLIDLGIRMHHCSVEEFLERLNNGNLDFSFRQQTSQRADPQPENPVMITGVKALSHPALVSYLESRKIDPAIAASYCKDIDFTIGGKSYFAIGFPNRSGGYELRNNWFKGASSPKDITIIDSGHKAAIVLEGFTDFLSLLQLKRGQSHSDFIILNSVALAERAVPVLQSYQEAFLMLNHDKAGIAAMEKLQAAGISFTDASGFYQGFNDINEYLVAQRQASLQPQIRHRARSYRI
ncbi:toprim domain-containing protein [Mucilaginibacter sp. BT774]|uniref:toprim domain-containing protein n=1 Tax=Mucilaginibacter sp. BT774 TaxID=3062276 RepID=UPI0026767AD7|nr:toprim domain-containing protein [Mucilaginibacter sp. BT774]MDO3629082.1 toprim domain-containing protein [Mucilaginibacter sp. BT774]